MASEFEHLHIKRNTAGSSNELSFDVLDAARSGTNKKPTRLLRQSKASKRAQGSNDGIREAAPLSQEDEVERRKRARRAHSIRIGIITTLVLAFAVAGVVAIGIAQTGKAKQFSEDFNSLVSDVSSEDSLMSKIDELMNRAPSDGSEKEKSDVLSQINASKENLQNTEDNVTLLQSQTSNNQDVIALERLTVSIEGRIEMLDAAEDAFYIEVNRGNLSKSAMDIWNLVIQADQTAKSAASLANRAETEDETKKARDETKTALDQMKKALESLTALSKENPDLNLSDQKEYVETRISSLTYAIETSDALIEGDRERAAEKNAQYNAADKKAAELASKLPLSAGSSVDEAFENEISSCREQYDAARQKVIAADSFIRDYISRN